MTAAPSGGQLRIALVAPSGSGKSTSARLLQHCFERQGLRVQVIKLAAPLYRLQALFYEEARRRIGEESQDQPLLEQIATALRRINPTSLIENFEQRLQASTADVVINDDLRDDETDWPFLRECGFRVVKVEAEPALRHQRLNLRNDAGVLLHSALDQQMARIPAHAVLQNNGGLHALQVAVERLAYELRTTARHACPALEGSAP